MLARLIKTIAPVYHADNVVLDLAVVFAQAFFEKACDHANRVWG